MSVDEYLMARVALVRKQRRREHWTRGGFQSAGRKLAEGVDMERIEDRTHVDEETRDWDRLREIAKGHIREKIRSPKMQTLVIWRLFEGERIIDLADVGGFSVPAVKSAVSRAYDYLGISRKQRKTRFKK